MAKEQVNNSEILRGKKWSHEYEIVPYSFFTFSRFYPTELGLGRRVVERPVGHRRDDLLEAVKVALKQLNNDSNNNNKNRSESQLVYSSRDFYEGLYRMDPIEGSHYELWFRSKDVTSNQIPTGLGSRLINVKLLRPHAPIAAVQVDHDDDDGDDSYVNITPVNIIVPLADRMEAFQSFLRRFRRLVLTLGKPVKRHNNVHLTVVLFGAEHWESVRSQLINLESSTGFTRFHLLNINGTFSRSVALQVFYFFLSVITLLLI